MLQWVGNLKTRLEQLRAYMANLTGPPLYDLEVFLRPDRFVEAVLQMYSRKQFKDLHSVVLTAEVKERLVSLKIKSREPSRNSNLVRDRLDNIAALLLFWHEGFGWATTFMLDILLSLIPTRYSTTIWALIRNHFYATQLC